MSSDFKAAVESVASIANSYRAGKQALSAAQRPKVCVDGATMHGSVDIDAALQHTYPNSRRWDYAVCHSVEGHAGQFISWIEVHPANPAEAKVILEKKDSLLTWLVGEGHPLAAFDCSYVWIASNNVGIPKNAPELRKLALEGVQGPCKFYRLRRRQCS